jgi:indolepyruvate ferredoxin oxidoreductase beta subunit
METKNIMIVGVGGQGTLLASKILGKAAMDAGLDVKVSEVHGMSQRGGSVVTYVRFGDEVYSTVIGRGDADVILSFELLEAARWLPHLKNGGTLVTSTQQINPMPVITGAAEYPSGILDELKARGIEITDVPGGAKWKRA